MSVDGLRRVSVWTKTKIPVQNAGQVKSTCGKR